MAATPWYTSDELIAAVKRKISLPISQVTFTEDDILAFANEEMAVSQVPAVLSYNEEFFTFQDTFALEEDRAKYPLPDRAIGMKLRDIFYQDSNDNLYEMTRISQDDRAYFDRNVGSNQTIHKFYVEGNNIVLVPTPSSGPTGTLLYIYFLRPNQLVRDERAAVITGFTDQVTLDNASISAGDTVSLGGETFTAVSSSPSTDEFLIGASSTATATNLKDAINANGIATASNGSPSTPTVTATYTNRDYDFTTSNASGFSILSTKGLAFSSIPSIFTAGETVDFLQTRGGHKTYGFDKVIQSVSTTSMQFTSEDIPEDLIVGDYLCLSHECIIPQIPTELHPGLAERTCARILSALGDTEGLSQTNAKIQDIQLREGNLIDNRVEGAPQKITARNSLLRYGKMGVRRRK